MYVFNNDEVGTVVEHLIINTAVNVALRYVCRKYIHFCKGWRDNSSLQIVGKCSTTQNNSCKESYYEFFRIRE